MQAGLKRRLSENGSERFFKGMKWRGIATPVLSDSYEVGRSLFAHNVKHKMWQLAIIIQFKRATTLLQFFNRTKMKKIEKKLGLTDAQKTQAKAIFQGNRDVVKPIFTTLHTEKNNLQALIHADTVDEAAIRAETAKIAGIQADLNVNRAKVGAQFRAILTPAQQAILKTVDHKRHKKGEAIIDPAE